MKLIELSNRLKLYATNNAIEAELFRFLKENPHLILQYNIEQLFHESIGADNVDLGFYSYATEKFDSTKKGGEPFTMIKTGKFFSLLTAEVYYKKIIITSDVPYLDDMINSPFYISNEFFGLTEDNLIRLKKFNTTPHIRQWIRGKLLK